MGWDGVDGWMDGIGYGMGWVEDIDWISIVITVWKLWVCLRCNEVSRAERMKGTSWWIQLRSPHHWSRYRHTKQQWVSVMIVLHHIYLKPQRQAGWDLLGQLDENARISLGVVTSFIGIRLLHFGVFVYCSLLASLHIGRDGLAFQRYRYATEFLGGRSRDSYWVVWRLAKTGGWCYLVR